MQHVNTDMSCTLYLAMPVRVMTMLTTVKRTIAVPWTITLSLSFFGGNENPMLFGVWSEKNGHQSSSSLLSSSFSGF